MYKIATLNKISPAGTDLLTDKYMLTENADEAEGIILRSYKMHDMELPKTLLAVGRAGAGVNNIPLDKCADNGIVVFNTPGANANAVKELVIGSLLFAARNVVEAVEWVKTVKGSDDVAKDVEKGKGQFAGSEIAGKTLCVIGLGAIGVMIANAADNLGMKVVGYDPYFSTKSAHNLNSSVVFEPNLEKAVSGADYITLHVPAMPSTVGMINEKLLSNTKDGVTLLNFSRDTLVDEKSVLEAVKSGKIKKYITDFATPNIFNVPNVVITPHLGASTGEAEDNCAIMATNQLMDYLENGNIVNSVNFPACNLGPKTDKTRLIILTTADETLDSISTKIKEAGATIINCAFANRGNYSALVADIDGNIGASLSQNTNILKVREI
ncbi:MAG: 3-phosphoglycerate dehydrogenase [Eubacteriales bacterium]|nr:3-phosphoglycerate dehydrogenase [Eubacteriales bacterium]MDY3333205.1 3-phosphoglycerate dehydrogenase [Gallibacter sp.]